MIYFVIEKRWPGLCVCVCDGRSELERTGGCHCRCRSLASHQTMAQPLENRRTVRECTPRAGERECTAIKRHEKPRKRERRSVATAAAAVAVACCYTSLSASFRRSVQASSTGQNLLNLATANKFAAEHSKQKNGSTRRAKRKRNG